MKKACAKCGMKGKEMKHEKKEGKKEMHKSKGDMMHEKYKRMKK